MKNDGHSIQDVKNKLSELEHSLVPFLKEIENGQNIVYNMDDPEQAFLRSQYVQILESLYDAVHQSRYLRQPIVAEGFLKKNESGRFCIDKEELTSGAVCELLFEGRWLYTSIEHHGDYYATTLGKNVSLAGLKARKRAGFWF